MENKIPTSLDILVKNNVFEKKEVSNMNLILYRDAHIKTQKDIVNSMIEFAKLHVIEALKQASEIKEPILLTDIKGNTKTTNSYVAYNTTASLNKELILNSYSLENIK